jgi:hypothetical protein
MVENRTIDKKNITTLELNLQLQAPQQQITTRKITKGNNSVENNDIILAITV